MRMLVAVICTALVAGCADRPGPADQAGRPDKVRVSGVPFHPQDGFRCGPAAMSMVLGWSGLPMEPAALENQFVQMDEDPRTTLVRTAHRFGRLAYPMAGSDALMDELAAGHPVLILQNLGVRSKPLWNCTVAVGYDRAAGEVILNSGDQADKRMPLSLFRRLWSETSEWGLVVLKPGDLPAATDRDRYLQAARALEKAGRHWEAVLAYDAALSRWPTDSGALMGLGSSLYLLGDRQGAADAYRAASTQAEDPRPALDALKLVLAELGQAEDSAKAAPQQASHGGR